MKRQYSRPVVEKISFDYRVQILTESQVDCFESVINERVGDGIPEQGPAGTACLGGTPFSMGWNREQTLVGG